MTILFDGRFQTTGNFGGYSRYAGYGSSLGPSGIYNQGAAPDGIDRLLLMADPLGGSDTVLRCYLKDDDPIGNFSAGARRSELSHTIGASEDDFETVYWHSWWFLLPADWVVDREEYDGPYTSLLQLHDTPDGDSGTGVVPASVDAAANTVTFNAGIVWPDRTMVRWQSLGGTIPSPFVEDTSYYVINPATADETIQLASSYANAVAGSAMDITSAGSGSFRLYDQTRAPNLMMRARAGYFEWLSAYENITGITGENRRLVARQPLQLGKWLNCTVKVRWSYGNTGTLAIWFGDSNGIRQIFNDASTINAWNDAESRTGDGVYPTLGCYCRDGLPSGVASRTVYHKGVQTGDSGESAASISGVPELEGFVTRGVSL